MCGYNCQRITRLVPNPGQWGLSFVDAGRLHLHSAACTNAYRVVKRENRAEAMNQTACCFIWSDSARRFPALSKSALKGKWEKDGVTEEKLQAGKQGI